MLLLRVEPGKPRPPPFHPHASRARCGALTDPTTAPACTGRDSMKARTMKRTILSMAILTSTLAVGVQPAGAGPAVGGCPSDYKLVSANKHDLGDTVDKNGDGKICEKPIPAFPPGSVNIIDNNRP